MKHIIEHVVATSIMNIMSRINYRFIARQNGPTINERATQALHVTMGKTQFTFDSPFHTTWSCSLDVITCVQ
jgi:hypothetical protein